MNIIVTGAKHSGKSTLIQKILKMYNGNVTGFITEFDDRSSLERELLIKDIAGEKSRCAVRWNNGPYEVFFDTFNDFASQLIKFDGELVVIDELGKFEKNCENLKCTVEKAFDSPCNVLASIRMDAVGWMHDLKERDDTRVFFLSEENREDLTAVIMNLLEITC